jgi:hypothetical protein
VFKKRQTQDQPRRRQADTAPVQADIKSFRRNRTITGSTSPRIASGNELNAEMASPRAKTHHMVRHRRHILGRLMLVIGVCVGIYLLLGQLVASVSVTASDSSLRLTDSDVSMYAKTVDEYFSRHINERFRPSLREDNLTAYLQQSHPEIQQARLVMAGGFGDAQLQLVFREPVARWIINDKTEFVDKTGIVFDHNIYPTPSLKIVDKNATTLEGGLVASNRFLSFVGQAVGDLKKYNLSVTQATIPLLTTRQLELKIKGVPYYFKLTVDRSTGEQTEDISRIVRYFKHRNKPTYVDVRVKGKAFYK